MKRTLKIFLVLLVVTFYACSTYKSKPSVDSARHMTNITSESFYNIITIKKDDTYVVKVFSILNPEGQRLFNLDIKLLGGAKIAKLPYISEIPYYFQTIDGITESIRKEQYDKTEKYQTK